MTAHNGGDLLVEVLRNESVDAAFGVVSVHNLPLVDALDRDLRWVPMRTEAGAVNAADGYARVTGGLGCAVTSTGTGAGNAAGALIESLTAGTPVLHVTGQVESDQLGSGRGVIHQFDGQLAMLDAVSGRSWTVHEDAAEILAHAVATALGGDGARRPVSVEWPIDLQYIEPGGRPAPFGGRSGALPSAEALGEAIGVIERSERPLLWVGGGVAAADATLDLLERLDAGLITSNAGRGVIPEDDPRVIGNFAATDEGQRILDEADLLVSVGTHFRSNETRSYGLRLPAQHVQIDIDPHALGRAYPATVGLAGDAGATVSALVERLAPVARPEWRARVADARSAARRDLRATIGPYGEICDALRRALPRDAVLARDITIPNSSWGNRLLEVYDPTTNLCPRGGGIGQALGLGIGAAIGEPGRRTLVLIGDGGLQVQLGELAAVAQERLPILIVVFDDGGYGVLRNMQDRHVGRRAGVDLFTPDIGAVMAAHGIPCVDVGVTADIESALDRALAQDGPFAIRVDCASIGPMNQPFVPPVRVPGRD